MSSALTRGWSHKSARAWLASMPQCGTSAACSRALGGKLWYHSPAMAESLPSDELVEEPSDYGSLQPGTRLGRYELLVPIARGGMARVWAARLQGQRGFQKIVAIKTILPHLA